MGLPGGQVSGSPPGSRHCRCLQSCSFARRWRFFWSELGSRCLSYLSELHLPTSSSSAYPAVVRLWLAGYTRLRPCQLTRGLIAVTPFSILAGSRRTVTEKSQAYSVCWTLLRVLSRVLGSWSRPGSLHDDLHWLNVPDWVFFKLAVTVHPCVNKTAACIRC